MSVSFTEIKLMRAVGEMQTKDGMKMGKSLGNVLEPTGLLKAYGADAVRFYFLKEIVFGQVAPLDYSCSFLWCSSSLGNLKGVTAINPMLHLRRCSLVIGKHVEPFKGKAAARPERTQVMCSSPSVRLS